MHFKSRCININKKAVHDKVVLLTTADINIFSPLQVFLSLPAKGHFADSHVISSVAVVEAVEKEEKD